MIKILKENLQYIIMICSKYGKKHLQNIITKWSKFWEKYSKYNDCVAFSKYDISNMISKYDWERIKISSIHISWTARSIARMEVLFPSLQENLFGCFFGPGGLSYVQIGPRKQNLKKIIPAYVPKREYAAPWYD